MSKKHNANNEHKSGRFCMPDPLGVLTDEVIIAQIAPGSRVLDLGCGDGRLLASLKLQIGAKVQGMELDLDAIHNCMARGIPVIQADLDQGLAGIPDRSFDVAVLSQTLQQVRQPQKLLQEMLRVASRALVVVPNFGHWKVRLQIVRHGRAPVTSTLPYEWYDTPNIHFMSMTDVRDLVRMTGARVVKEIPIVNGRAAERVWIPNLRADSALYIIDRQDPSPTTNSL